MRLLESLLCVISLITIIYSLFNLRKKNNKNYFVLLVLVPLIIGHFILEGLRWQMFGPYVYILYLLYRFLIVRKKRLSIGEGGEKKPPVIILLVLVLLSSILVRLFQVNEMPEPSGMYNIGTITFDIVDEDRNELYDGSKDDYRKFRAQFWYPADDVSEGTSTKWMSDGLDASRQIPAQVGLPGFLLDHSVLIKSHSYEGVNLSTQEESYPIVILSHGWTGFRHLHSDMAELLASHGYIVVSIEHTYGSLATVFENGEVALVNPEALPNREETENFLEYANDLVSTYGYDSGRVIDFIEELNQTSLFDNKADLSRVGALGHSTGGGGVVKLALEDSRVKAVFGLDPWVEPIGHEQLENGLDIPALFIRSEQWEVGYNNDYLSTLVKASTIKAMTYQLNGSNHQDFTMLYMFRPINELTGFSGALDSQESLNIRLDFMLQFFNQTLKGEDLKVEDLVNDYEPMIKVEY